MSSTSKPHIDLCVTLTHLFVLHMYQMLTYVSPLIPNKDIQDITDKMVSDEWASTDSLENKITTLYHNVLEKLTENADREDLSILVNWINFFSRKISVYWFSLIKKKRENKDSDFNVPALVQSYVKNYKEFGDIVQMANLDKYQKHFEKIVEFITDPYLKMRIQKMIHIFQTRELTEHDKTMVKYLGIKITSLGDYFK